MNKNISDAISSLRIVSIWLDNLRDKKDLRDAIDKIGEVIKILENE